MISTIVLIRYIITQITVLFSEVVTRFTYLVHAPLPRVSALRLPTPQRRSHKR